jgi:SAM-dependent methyltransferase
MRRLPFRAGSFGGVVQFFTSFGYFDSREEDGRVLEEVRRVLRPGGAFLLDFLNAGQVRREMVPEDVREIDGRTVRQRRRIEGDRVVKEIEIDGRGREDPETFRERVRLYEPDELVSMLEDAGLRVRERRGDYGGAPFGKEAPRLLLAGEAT